MPNKHKDLIDRLPKNWARLIANSLGVSTSTVYSALHGMRNNPRVINTAQLLANEYEKKTTSRIKDAVNGL
jgi:4-diphosphocytidyl-2C-methyl-D-erythritol kinase